MIVKDIKISEKMQSKDQLSIERTMKYGEKKDASQIKSVYFQLLQVSIQKKLVLSAECARIIALRKYKKFQIFFNQVRKF